ncbi:MAG TPA: alpha/beta fold hydrolase [Stellaceae bacterium]|nr:alpha/beta fold hydrolase [Stellaceae bacterium]
MIEAQTAQTPDRRLAPRPLPAHLTSAAGLWLSSSAALPLWKFVSPLWSEPGRRLRALAQEIEAFGVEQVGAALDAEIAHRTRAYIDGLEAYRRHPYRRGAAEVPVRWQEGTTRLLDYSVTEAGPAVLIIPSLVNRYYVLDLLPERSFLRHLAGHRLRPMVVDWGEPGPTENGLGLGGHIRRLERAFAAAMRLAGRPLAVIGYCMGGLLALALALRRHQQVSSLVLLATPWDFHAGRETQARLLGVLGDWLSPSDFAALPVEFVQGLFFVLDPFLGQRKFVRFAGLDQTGEAARSFVALEDWINDGVPLPIAVARECLRSWYGDNAPGRGLWEAAGTRVCPQQLHRPALVVIPARDKIVPPASAAALAAVLPASEALRPALGHIGMMSAVQAPEMLWTPIAEWLTARFDTATPRPRRRLDSSRARS